LAFDQYIVNMWQATCIDEQTGWTIPWWFQGKIDVTV